MMAATSTSLVSTPPPFLTPTPLPIMSSHPPLLSLLLILLLPLLLFLAQAVNPYLFDDTLEDKALRAQGA